MSDLQPENYPHASEQMDGFVFDSDSMPRLIEERAASVVDFFRTEVGAYAILRRVAETQEERGQLANVCNERGYWQYCRPIEYNPDYADSSKRRFLNVIFHTTRLGTYPRLAVRADLEQAPVEYYERSELLVAHAALKGEDLAPSKGSNHPMITLMGPDSEERKSLIDRQQKYARWVSIAAHITGVSLVKRSQLFTPPGFSSAN